MSFSRSTMQRVSRTFGGLRAGGRQFHAAARRRMPQDMPPEGGYEPVQYKRNLPAIGFKPRVYIFGVIAIMAYGWYRLYVGISEWNELGREKMWSRIHLIPLLQAEEDRDQVRRHYHAKEMERDLLGKEVNVYHSDRFVRPTYSPAPPRITKKE